MSQAATLWPRSRVHKLVGTSYYQVDRWERAGYFDSTIKPTGQGSRPQLDREALGGLAVLATIWEACIYRGRVTVPRWNELCAVARGGGVWLWLPAERRLIKWPPTQVPELGVLINAEEINAQLERNLSHE